MDILLSSDDEIEKQQTSLNTKPQYKPIKIQEPYRPKQIGFTTAQEFNDYYLSHIDDFVNKTTRQLNLAYHIDGYRISQRKDDKGNKRLCLQKDYRGERIEESSEIRNRISTLERSINILQQQVKQCVDWINHAAND